MTLTLFIRVIRAIRGPSLCLSVLVRGDLQLHSDFQIKPRSRGGINQIYVGIILFFEKYQDCETPDFECDRRTILIILCPDLA
jgi:hypothetical protein